MKIKNTFENFIKKKIQTVDSLCEISKNKKKNNKKIVLCHGTFDLLHAGHFRHFQDSKNLGDVLVVTVTSDKFIKTVSVDQYSDSKVNAPTREQRYTVTPNPASASADDDFGFNETSSFFQDAGE